MKTTATPLIAFPSPPCPECGGRAVKGKPVYASKRIEGQRKLVGAWLVCNRSHWWLVKPDGDCGGSEGRMDLEAVE